MEPIEPPIECAPADPELTRRLRLVPVHAFEDAGDLRALGAREQVLVGFVAEGAA
jgi:hypothetical protein